MPFHYSVKKYFPIDTSNTFDPSLGIRINTSNTLDESGSSATTGIRIDTPHTFDPNLGIRINTSNTLDDSQSGTTTGIRINTCYFNYVIFYPFKEEWRS